MGHGTWELSSPTRDPACIPCIGSLESSPLDCQGNPQHYFWKTLFPHWTTLLLWHFCKICWPHVCVGLFQDSLSLSLFWSIDLHWSVFLEVSHCLDDCSFIICWNYMVRSYSFVLLKIALATLGSLNFHINLIWYKSACQFLPKIITLSAILMRIALDL